MQQPWDELWVCSLHLASLPEPAVWGRAPLRRPECPSLPGIPAKMPRLQISLLSQEALFPA